LTVFTGAGEITYAQVREAIVGFYAGSHTLKVLWDLREANARPISAQEVDQLALLLNDSGRVAKGVRTALVTPRDATFGLSRMLIALLEGRAANASGSMQVFREMDEARAWLGER
jgi:hypothetical protein